MSRTQPVQSVALAQNGLQAADEQPAARVKSQSARSIAATTIPKMVDYQGEPTKHVLRMGDARNLDWIADQSIHLIVTSPPYFNLKRYNDHEGQMGHIEELDEFLNQLDLVWRHCYRVLVPGGRLVCNVGDVCVSRRKNKGRHHVVPLHAHIAVRAQRIGFDYLTPILWHKIANASFEAEGNGAGFLGKPYEPNGIIKNDIEYVLLLRKHGAYRSPSDSQRASSRLSKEEQSRWFRPIWADLPGETTRKHPAPFPVEFAYRLVRMFSFTGDTVLDPFGGIGSTTAACIKANRHSILNEVDPAYFDMAKGQIFEHSNQAGLLSRPPVIQIYE